MTHIIPIYQMCSLWTWQILLRYDTSHITSIWHISYQFIKCTLCEHDSYHSDM